MTENIANNSNTINNKSANEINEKLSDNCTKRTEDNYTIESRNYLKNLIENGHEEQDESSEMHLPPWFDKELFKKGQSYMSKYRFVMFSGMLSGLLVVLAIPSILNVLVCTRQSGNAQMAYKRYVRTILHTLTWHDYPLEPGSKSWRSIEIVRKAHYHSSKKCLKAKAGSISQKDLALTQFGFFGFITLGAWRIHLYDQDFLEATVHVWRTIGYLLGIKDEFNICTESWQTTKPRLEIVLSEIYRPALQKPSEDFIRMTKALIEGLWPVNTFLTYNSYMFFAKRLAFCDGYEYYDFDYLEGKPKLEKEKLAYYDLGWYDRFLVSYGLYIVTYLHQYFIVRWYFNFRVWLNSILMYYLPYMAFYKFGFKWSYVRIFNTSINDLHED